MKCDYTAIYRPLFGYIYQLTSDYQDAQDIIAILIRMQVPLQTFITSIIIYKKTLLKYSIEELVEESNGLRRPYVLLIVCFSVSYKYHNDIAYPNDSWKTVSRVSRSEINRLEYKMLRVLHFEFESGFERVVLSELRNYVPKKYFKLFDQSKKKGMFNKAFSKIFCIT